MTRQPDPAKAGQTLPLFHRDAGGPDAERARPRGRLARRPPKGASLSVTLNEAPISVWVNLQAERARHLLPALVEVMEQAADQIEERLAGEHETNRKGGPLRRAEAAKVAAKQAPELRASVAELRTAAATLRALPRPTELLPRPKPR